MKTIKNQYLQHEARTIFPTALHEQAEAIANHQWAEYSDAHRSSNAGHPAVPHYHYTAPEGFFNDGTGMCKWQGRWHLFYGAFPEREDADNTFVWGHAVSDDLIHWQDLPWALLNGPEAETWTGAVYVEENRVIAAYRAYHEGRELGIGIAISSDPLLLNWEKLNAADGTPLVIKANAENPAYNTGDPCIWKKDGAYYLLSGKVAYHEVSGEMIRQGYLFHSTDLINWDYIGPFIHNDIENKVCDDLSCPTFWPLGSRHILIHFSHTHSSRYLIGKYDRKNDRFLPCASRSFGNGSLLSGGAGQPTSCVTEDGVIMMYEMNKSLGETWYPPVFSIPRRLRLAGKYQDELEITPYGDFASLRENYRCMEATTLPEGEDVLLEGLGGQSYEMIVEFSAENVSVLELCVLRSPDREEVTKISFLRQRGPAYRQVEKEIPGARQSVLALDATQASIDPGVVARAPEQESWFLAPGEPLRLHIFVDVNIVEVFANNRVCLCVRPAPSRPDSTGVSVRTRGGSITMTKLEAWDLKQVHFQNYK